MKILHIINSLNTGGAEKLLLESLPIYHKKGNDVDLLLLDGSDYPFLTELKSTFKGNIYSLSKKSVYNPYLIFKIIPYLRKYDIINAHLFPTLYWVSIAKILSFSKTTIVYTEHNTNNKRRNSFIFKIVDKILYRPYSKIITIAKEVDKNIKHHLKFNNSKFTLINNGINVDKYINASSYSNQTFFEGESIILIQVSSFTKQKNQKTLIKSLLYLPVEFKLLLVGEGPLKDNNKLLVKQLKLENRVSFLGIRMDVPKLLKTAQIVVLSSHHEGLSLSSIEAMASGRPFVASKVPGLKEIVNGAGLLFEDANETELSNHILDLINDKQYYNSIVKKCLIRAKKYDINTMVDAYISLYSNLKNT